MTDAPAHDALADEVAEPKRPFALLILAGLLLFKAGLAVAALVGAHAANNNWLMPGILRMNPEFGEFLQGSAVADEILVGLAVLLVVAAIGLVRLQRRGWVLAMVVTGLFVALDIYAYIQGVPNHLWMGLNIITVFYLNQEDVREVVGVNSASILDVTAAP